MKGGGPQEAVQLVSHAGWTHTPGCVPCRALAAQLGSWHESQQGGRGRSPQKCKVLCTLHSTLGRKGGSPLLLNSNVNHAHMHSAMQEVRNLSADVPNASRLGYMSYDPIPVAVCASTTTAAATTCVALGLHPIGR